MNMPKRRGDTLYGIAEQFAIKARQALRLGAVAAQVVKRGRPKGRDPGVRRVLEVGIV